MLGVLGGGQLGRMWAHAAQTLGYQTAVLDPDPHSPAGLMSHLHLCADYLDPQALAQMAQQCAAITTEFENVPAQALAQLAQTRFVSPAAAAVAVAQDRAQEKAHFTRCGVPVAPHAVLDSAAAVAAVSDALLPGILKTARLGYDGKGQARVANRAELLAAWQAMQSGDPGHATSSATVCVLEKMLPLAAECSVVLARGQDGQMVHLPVQANLHRDGILALTEVGDGAIDPALAAQALAAAREVAALGDKAEGALASELAAEIYGLDVLARHVEDQANNTTRFLVMSRQADHTRRAADMITTFVFRVRNIPAALYKAMGGFATNGVNMTKLESYMIGGSFTATEFYADIEGHPEDPNVALALEELGYFTSHLQILGVYPADRRRG